MTTNPLPTITFETTDCGRCAGTGFFGPLSIDGGRCFGCAGGKIVLTRAGKIARKRYDDIMNRMKVTLDLLKVGDRIKTELSSTTSWSLRKRARWYTVSDITVTAGRGSIGDVPALTYDFVLEGVDHDKWTMGSFLGSNFPTPVWDHDIYLEAINACRRLKGATIIDSTPVVETIEELLSPVVTPVVERINTSRVRGSHADCDHAATPADRRRCRASRA